jgi:hypothetical protein
MAKKNPYSAQMRQEFESIIAGLVLQDIQKEYLSKRWLDQVMWFDGKAGYNQRRYYALRLLTIVGGVVVPAIVSLNVRQANVTAVLAWVTFSVSLVVALAAALEGFFRFGERWRTFRRTAEVLKAHGWQFFELAGPYAAPDHATVFPIFAAQVETLVQQDVQAYIAAMAQPQAPAQAEEEGEEAAPAARSATARRLST